MDQSNKKRRFSELKIQPVEYVFCEICYKKTTINDHCFFNYIVCSAQCFEKIRARLNNPTSRSFMT